MNSKALEFEIRDEHLAPLRLFLTGDSAGLDPFEKEPEDSSVKAERWLFAMATGVAMKRRFGDSFTRPQIIRFVADLRKAMGEHAGDVNPRVAEELIRMALNDVHPGEIDLANRDPEEDLLATLAILDQARDEGCFSEDKLDDFLLETKQYAQELLEVQRSVIAQDAHPLITP